MAGGVFVFVGFLLFGIGTFLGRLLSSWVGSILGGLGYILAGVGFLIAFLGLARRA